MPLIADSIHKSCRFFCTGFLFLIWFGLVWFDKFSLPSGCRLVSTTVLSFNLKSGLPSLVWSRFTRQVAKDQLSFYCPRVHKSGVKESWPLKGFLLLWFCFCCNKVLIFGSKDQLVNCSLCFSLIWFLLFTSIDCFPKLFLSSCTKHSFMYNLYYKDADCFVLD